MVFATLKAGLARVFAHWPIVFIFYLANVLIAFMAIMPFRRALGDYLGESMMGAEIGGLMNPDFFIEFLNNQDGVAAMIFPLILTALLVYLSVNLFLAGGAFNMFVRGGEYSTAEFWAGCGRYFGRFFRLVMVSLLLAGVLALGYMVLRLIIYAIVGDDAYQYVTYWVRFVNLGLVALLFVVYFMIVDFARIHIVADNTTSTWDALTAGIGFCRRYPRRTFTLAFAFWLLGYVGLLIYNFLADMLVSPNTLVVVALFLLQQMYMVFRMVVRLGLYAGQVSLREILVARELDNKKEPVEDLETGVAT